MFSATALFSISLTPRFSEVDGPVPSHNRFSGFLVRRQKTAEAVRPCSDIINTPLKQGVNESSSYAKHTFLARERHPAANNK
jgi:hypothetical protein